MSLTLVARLRVIITRRPDGHKDYVAIARGTYSRLMRDARALLAPLGVDLLAIALLVTPRSLAKTGTTLTLASGIDVRVLRRELVAVGAALRRIGATVSRQRIALSDSGEMGRFDTPTVAATVMDVRRRVAECPGI